MNPAINLFHVELDFFLKHGLFLCNIDMNFDNLTLSQEVQNKIRTAF